MSRYLTELVPAIQRFLGGGLVRRLENEAITLRSKARTALHAKDVVTVVNKRLAQRIRDLNRALDARSERGTAEALIVGRSRFGEIIRDTGTTFNEVYLPDHGVSITVSETSIDVHLEPGHGYDHNVHGWDPYPTLTGGPGFARLTLEKDPRP